jgi:hypothetical protein
MRKHVTQALPPLSVAPLIARDPPIDLALRMPIVLDPGEIRFGCRHPAPSLAIDTASGAGWKVARGKGGIRKDDLEPGALIGPLIERSSRWLSLFRVYAVPERPTHGRPPPEHGDAGTIVRLKL